MINGAQYIRRELMIRLVRAFDAGTLDSELDRIPVKLRPKDGPSSRCCLYHDRAVLKYRLMSLLGFSSEEETDETRPLGSYASEACERTTPAQGNPLSVCAAGCSACANASVVVTENCRGCFARPCLYNCPKQAISVVNQTSVIDPSRCIKCGKCIGVCPFHAIVKTTVPCEEACPVDAIRKGPSGRAVIDFDKCIFCGKCFAACPFSAVMERSRIMDLLEGMKRGETLVAMVAPSAAAQFPGTIEQLFSAIAQLGFADVIEVALGAEVTTREEAAEFRERISAGERLMTTSCCPAYVELVRKHYPSFLKHVSATPSPMVHTMRIVKETNPNAKTVFVGPCIAKRLEAMRTGVDYVLSFEELGAILAGRKMDVITCAPWPIPRPASVSARNYAKSCGVTKAVLDTLFRDESCGITPNSQFVDGIDRKTLSMLRLHHTGKLSANFLEVMACRGGCINGPTSLAK